jgi:hypothetical protein
MTRLEISGYVQIVIGLVGIVLTLLTAPSILDAFGHVTAGQGLPREFNTVSGGIRVFGVMVVLGVLLLLVIIGASITLSTFFKAAGAGHPTLAASWLVLGIFGMAATATLGLFRSPLWVPGFVGSLGALLIAAAAMDKDDPKGEAAGLVAFFFLILFLGTGAVTVGIMSSPGRDINSPLVVNNAG